MRIVYERRVWPSHLTGDGAVDVLVGAPQESSGAEAAGALYLISL